RDEITDIDYVAQKKSTTLENSGLDINEQMLINTYRDMTTKGQKVLMDTANTLHENFKKNDIVQNNDNQVG
ncbi:MAG: hypothetical protein RR902_00755, partial [Oscillospiraceae bacterium]